MKCEQFQKLIPDYLVDGLNKKNRSEFILHEKKCLSCRHELKELAIVWVQLKEMPSPQPSENLKIKFENMLFSFKKEIREDRGISVNEKIKNFWETFLSPRPAWQIAAILLVLTVGFLGGSYFSSTKSTQKKVSALQSEIAEMRELVSLSLLQQNSPGARLQGVHWSQSVEELHPRLFSALINTLNNDPNVNVRLAAANSLYLFSDQADVRTQLVESLALQESPLVQISLINLLVEIRERQALHALNVLLQNNHLNTTVKEQVEEGIKQLKSL